MNGARLIVALLGGCLMVACAGPAGAPAVPSSSAPAVGGSAIQATSAPAAPPSPVALRAISIAHPTANPQLVPFRLAITEGFFREEGLDAQMIQIGSSAFAPAMLNDEIDYSTLFGATVRLAAAGAPVKAIMVLNDKPLFYLIAQPGIASVPDLRGQEVGVGPRGGTLDHLARDIFTYYGLDPQTDLVSRSFQQIDGTLPALLAGQIQAAVVPPPLNLQAEAQGMKMLVDAADLFRAASGGVTTTERKLRERPDEVRGVLRATLRGMEFMRSHRAPALAEMVSWAGIDAALADGAYDGVVKSFTSDGLATDDEIQPEIDSAKEQMGTPDAVIPVSQVVDFTLLRSVLAEPRR
ncbi:MAG TPA: ABC transporter substrate-binding protein [Chloroflexota bacterium]|nr:ABC transporter substrate-binding protein [Chloroflexota bacterium]